MSRRKAISEFIRAHTRQTAQDSPQATPGEQHRLYVNAPRATCALLTPPSQPVGEGARLPLPRAHPHRHRCRLLRRLHAAHHEAQRGEQAGKGRAPRRVPAAVAAGAPGCQLPQPHRGPLDEPRRCSSNASKSPSA
eukprot:scaffold90171_cov57-Phaeocystis_antarctica.AAC.3